jgi:hypothetical protein
VSKEVFAVDFDAYENNYIVSQRELAQNSNAVGVGILAVRIHRRLGGVFFSTEELACKHVIAKARKDWYAPQQGFGGDCEGKPFPEPDSFDSYIDWRAAVVKVLDPGGWGVVGFITAYKLDPEP